MLDWNPDKIVIWSSKLHFVSLLNVTRSLLWNLTALLSILITWKLPSFATFLFLATGGYTIVGEAWIKSNDVHFTHVTLHIFITQRSLCQRNKNDALLYWNLNKYLHKALWFTTLYRLLFTSLICISTLRNSCLKNKQKMVWDSVVTLWMLQRVSGWHFKGNRNNISSCIFVYKRRILLYGHRKQLYRTSQSHIQMKCNCKISQFLFVPHYCKTAYWPIDITKTDIEFISLLNTFTYTYTHQTRRFPSIRKPDTVHHSFNACMVLLQSMH